MTRQSAEQKRRNLEIVDRMIREETGRVGKTAKIGKEGIVLATYAIPVGTEFTTYKGVKKRQPHPRDTLLVCTLPGLQLSVFFDGTITARPLSNTRVKNYGDGGSILAGGHPED